MKARLKFSKAGSMKFIGHLDIMRYFQKAFRRSGIDISYSKGYSPHQLISFAAPLGVGLTSDSEYMDMQLESCLSSNEMIEKINSVMNEEIRIIDFIGLEDASKPAMSIVAAADYMISLKDGYCIMEQFQEKFSEFIEQDTITILKKTKKSEKEMDIAPFIYKFAFTKEEFATKTNSLVRDTIADFYNNDNKVFLQLTTGSVVNLKPNLVMEAFHNFVGITYEPFAYQVHRMEVYSDLHADTKNPDFTTPEIKELVPLNQLGYII